MPAAIRLLHRAVLLVIHPVRPQDLRRPGWVAALLVECPGWLEVRPAVCPVWPAALLAGCPEWLAEPPAECRVWLAALLAGCRVWQVEAMEEFLAEQRVQQPAVALRLRVTPREPLFLRKASVQTTIRNGPMKTFWMRFENAINESYRQSIRR